MMIIKNLYHQNADLDLRVLIKDLEYDDLIILIICICIWGKTPIVSSFPVKPN